MIDILMPRLSDTMTEGAIAAWRKKPGDMVKPGDILVEIETDKALMEQEAYDAGTLVEILVPEGQNVEIGTPIARLDDGQNNNQPESGSRGAATPPTAGGTAAVNRTSAETASTPRVREHDPKDRRAATPLVRRLARERGIDLHTVSGSGPAGRIVRADLPGAAAPATDPSSVPEATRDRREPTRVPFDAVRQAVAARLTASGSDIPTFTVTASADVDHLLSLRAEINSAHSEVGVKVSVNDLLLRAAAVALRLNPAVNASYDPEGHGHTLLHARVNVGFAVASPAGLIVPVVHDADRVSVSAIAITARTLVSRASERKLTSADMSDGTFTISNLGMFGIDHFTALINPPQGAILAVGAVRDELALENGRVESRKRLTFTLTADHRIIDGADAARFLATLSTLLEDPLRMIS